MINFSKLIDPGIRMTLFHQSYYDILDSFARGQIKKLIVTIPPQHGKSYGSSIMLPAFLLGIDPSLRIAIASYSKTLAARFNRRIRHIMGSETYGSVFPGTKIPTKKDTGYICSSSEFDIVGQTGGLISVGREGALTGNTVDIMIIDDLYKNAMEAYSPVIRSNTWEWYNSVVKTRLHNDSRELIVFTRWHEDDLIGKLSESEKIVMISSTFESDTPQDDDCWFRVNFEGLKNSPPTLLDPRQHGEALWPERHSKKSLEKRRKLDPVIFEAMYQGNPSSEENLLYGRNLLTYEKLPKDIVTRGNYTDTADTGDDFLCSICYSVCLDGFIYLTDIVYSSAKMEITEPQVAEMLARNRTAQSYIESNNGGRGFARAISKLAPGTHIEWFHQSRNKEARILSNVTAVLRHIRFPHDWSTRWPELYHDLTTYRRVFRSNRRHDAPDVITGIVETEIENSGGKRIKAVGFI